MVATVGDRVVDNPGHERIGVAPSLPLGVISASQLPLSRVLRWRGLMLVLGRHRRSAPVALACLNRG
jgi:hypothetical protein